MPNCTNLFSYIKQTWYFSEKSNQIITYNLSLRLYILLFFFLFLRLHNLNWPIFSALCFFLKFKSVVDPL